MKEVHFILLVILICSYSLSIGHAAPVDRPLAQRGVLDLSEWDFEKDGLVFLHGEWDYRAGQFLAPRAWIQSQTGDNQFCIVPGIWVDTFDFNNFNSYQGYFTFHLKVKLNRPDQILFIKMSQFCPAFKVWIDEQLVLSNGTIGRTAPVSQPLFQCPPTNVFHSQKEIFHITVHCSNFRDRFGTLSQNIVIGSKKAMDQYTMRLRSLDVASVVLMVMCIIWFILLYKKTKNRHIYYLPGLCLAIIMRIIFAGERIAFCYLDPWPAIITYKFLYCAYYFSCLFLLLFSAAIFKDYFPARIKNQLVIACCLFIAVTLGASIPVMTSIVLLFHIVTALIFIFILRAVVQSLATMKRYAFLFLISTIFIFGLLLNDILILSAVIKIHYFIEPYVIVLLAVFHAFYFLKQSSLQPGQQRSIQIDPLFRLFKLTSREKDVALLLIKGLTNTQIADELFISRNTVKFHMKNIYHKAGVSNRHSFTALFYQDMIN